MSEHPTPESEPTERLLALAASSLAASCLSRIVLSKPRGADTTLERVTVRPVVLKGQLQLSFVASHTTRDLTSNLPPDAGWHRLRELIEHRRRFLIVPIVHVRDSHSVSRWQETWIDLQRGCKKFARLIGFFL
ncbi:MAG: hypothetical protein ACM32J_15800, partial [Rhizobacter sp.]